MDAIISIKPVYSRQILAGTKKYEFRKQVMKPVDRVYIYETRPTKRIVGYFTIKKILVDDPLKIWEMTYQAAGIEFRDYEQYYLNFETAVAYQIDKFVKFKTPKILKRRPPQSFYYIN